MIHTSKQLKDKVRNISKVEGKCIINLVTNWDFLLLVMKGGYEHF